MLKDLLRTAEFAALTSEDVVTHLGKVVEISRNTERQTITDVASKLGFPALIAIAERLKGTPFETLMLVVQSGCSFADPQTQEAIKAVEHAGILTAEEAAAFLSLGVVFGPRWQKEGLPALPSVEQIDAERKQIAADDLKPLVAKRYNEIVAKLDRAELTTWDSVVDALGAK